MQNKEIDVTTPNPKERNLFFSKQVDQETIGELIKNIIEINEYDDFMEKLYPVHGFVYKRKPINLYIDSYGGEVYGCFGLLSIMENSKTKIFTFITGCAMSCGFMIAICGHKRFCYKLSTPLYHQVGSLIYGKLRDMENDVAEVKRLQKKIEEIVLSKTKLTKKQLKKIYKTKKNWYITPKRALKYGIVDKII